MSNKVFKIERTSRNCRWETLSITHYVADRTVWDVCQYNCGSKTEPAALYSLISELVEISNCEDLKCKLYQGFCQLQQHDSDGNSQHSMEIFVGLLEHFSCKINNKDFAAQLSNEKEVSQSQVKHKLANFKEDNAVMKFFEENKCSVCLTSYKDIFEDNFHLVVPSCGHPLCCKCADEVLASEKNKCPRCRENVTADSFNLVKFNGDLEMDNHHQRVFL